MSFNQPFLIVKKSSTKKQVLVQRLLFTAICGLRSAVCKSWVYILHPTFPYLIKLKMLKRRSNRVSLNQWEVQYPLLFFFLFPFSFFLFLPFLLLLNLIFNWNMKTLLFSLYFILWISIHSQINKWNLKCDYRNKNSSEDIYKQQEISGNRYLEVQNLHLSPTYIFPLLSYCPSRSGFLFSFAFSFSCSFLIFFI